MDLVNFYWLGWQDLNLRMPESKSGALPLGDTPTLIWGERWESNPRPPGPQSDALTDCATPAIGAPEGIRTPDTRLRRAVLYPAELQAHIVPAESPMPSHILERVMGIGPTRPAWKAGVLPLNYTRITSTMLDYSIKNNQQCQTFYHSFLKIFKLIFL